MVAPPSNSSIGRQKKDGELEANPGYKMRPCLKKKKKKKNLLVTKNPVAPGI
jgi:hypothetical protein